jgi:DNA-binding NarL/FixJ family response regulator
VRNLSSGELSEKTVDVGHYLRKLKELYIDANAEKFRLLKKHLTLSQREKEIANLLATGLSTKQIGEKLHISFYTVESHRKNLLQKLEAKNTAELIHRMNRILVQMEISA